MFRLISIVFLSSILLFKNPAMRVMEPSRNLVCIQRGATDQVFLLLAPELPGRCQQWLRNWSQPENLRTFYWTP